MDLVLTLAAAVVLFWAAATDVAHRRISNRLVLALAAVGLSRIALEVVAAPGSDAAISAVGDLGAALTVFCVGALAFRFRALGGGDVKLLAACTLWVGASGFGPFLALTAISGGLLAIGYVTFAAVSPAGGASLRRGLPYGVAIAMGGIWATLAAM